MGSEPAPGLGAGLVVAVLLLVSTGDAPCAVLVEGMRPSSFETGDIGPVSDTHPQSQVLRALMHHDVTVRWGPSGNGLPPRLPPRGQIAVCWSREEAHRPQGRSGEVAIG